MWLRICRKFRFFIAAAGVVLLLMTPFYMQMVMLNRQRAVGTVAADLSHGLKLLEKELYLQAGVVKKVANTEAFRSVATASSEPADALYTAVHTLKNKLEQIGMFMTMQADSFIIFKNSDVLIHINRADDSFKNSYGSKWELEGVSYDEAFGTLFGKRYTGGFSARLKYSNLMSNETGCLVYLLTLSTDMNGYPDSVLVTVYKPDNLIKALGLETEHLKFIQFSGRDGALIYQAGTPDNFERTVNSTGLPLAVTFCAADQYLAASIRPENTVFLLLLLVLLGVGTVAFLLYAYAEQSRVERVLQTAERCSGKPCNGAPDAYLSDTVQKAYDAMRETDGKWAELLFIKLIATGLAAEEYARLSQTVAVPACMLLIRSYAESGSAWQTSLLKQLDEAEVEVQNLFITGPDETVLFVRDLQGDTDAVREVMIKTNRGGNLDVRGVFGIAYQLQDVPALYRRLKKATQYLEYGTLRMIDDVDRATGENEMQAILTKNRQLYEIIRSGNCFEAQRLVYEQWYKISENSDINNGIERLFYAQAGILAQLCTDLKVKINLPVYDMHQDVVSVAVSIAECIEELCSRVNVSQPKDDSRGRRLVEYIQERYTDSAFYMPELVGKFGLSDRAISQLLKRITGETFSNYVGKMRLSRAVQLLEDTALPIAEVAASSGFDSSNSLYKAFKKAYGVSPSVYRENRRKTKKEGENSGNSL